MAITTILMMKRVFNLPLRALQGFVEWPDKYRECNHAVANQHQSGSNDVWKRKVGYNRRSVAETVMFGIKNLAGRLSEPAGL